jgi:hypothetical protein
VWTVIVFAILLELTGVRFMRQIAGVLGDEVLEIWRVICGARHPNERTLFDGAVYGATKRSLRAILRNQKFVLYLGHAENLPRFTGKPQPNKFRAK